MIYALNQDNSQLRPYLEKQKQMTVEDTLQVQRLVQELGGVDYAQQLATEYTEQALKDIRKLPDNYFNTKEKLERLTSQILSRKS